MILSFTAIDKRNEFRAFSCQLNDLETALNTVSSISSEGDTIISAQVADESSCLNLPIDVFDGEIFSVPLQQLKKQWQAILHEPAHLLLPDNSWHIDLTQQRIKLYDNRIDQFTLVISRFERLRQRVEETIIREPHRSNLLNYYDLTLDKYHQQVERTQVGKELTLKKLKQLERRWR